MHDLAAAQGTAGLSSGVQTDAAVAKASVIALRPALRLGSMVGLCLCPEQRQMKHKVMTFEMERKEVLESLAPTDLPTVGLSKREPSFART